jgi:hypothetical protein
MNLKRKAVLTVVLLFAVLLVAAGCSKVNDPYKINDADSYNFSVKYDANGGTFTTNTSVIVDSYDLSQVKKNAQGQAEIALLSPDNAVRGNNAFTAIRNGYFLAGWYTQRTEAGTDDNGNTLYTYSGKWDFDKDILTADPNKSYSASNPELTLYAAWIPMFQVEYYVLGTNELLGSNTYDPTQADMIKMPQWNTDTGAIKMNNIPKRDKYTFNGAYLDAQGTVPITGEQIAHTGTVNYENATAENPIMKIYVDWKAGEWYRIYTAKQFVKTANLSGCYEIMADLDFTDEIWPSVLMHGNFTGIIQGNGHTFSNIQLTQKNNNKMNSGLFGNLTADAQLTDLTFRNVTFTMEGGTRAVGAAFGLLAGTVSDGAVLNNVQIKQSTLQIDSRCYFQTEDYSIGLVCGMGNATIDASEITCVAVGSNPEKVQITVSGNTVTVKITA